MYKSATTVFRHTHALESGLLYVLFAPHINLHSCGATFFMLRFDLEKVRNHTEFLRYLDATTKFSSQNYRKRSP